MVMKKVEFYYESEGQLSKAVLNSQQYHYALTYCRDYNSLLAYISSVTEWIIIRENDDEDGKEMA